MRRLPALLLASWLALPAAAATPRAVIRGPSAAPAGTPLILLDGSQSVGDEKPKWKILNHPELTPTIFYTADGKPSYAGLIVPPPGRYQFALFVAGVPDGGHDLDYDGALWEVVVGTIDPPQPPPGPTPDPIPKPPPAPQPTPVVSGPVYATLVYDYADATPGILDARTDATLAATLKAFDASWHAWEQSDSNATRLNLPTYVAKAGGTPALVVQDAAGKVVSTVRVAGKDAIVAELRRLRGGK